PSRTSWRARWRWSGRSHGRHVLSLERLGALGRAARWFPSGSAPCRAVGSRIAARDAHREPFEVERPTMAVVVDRVVRQARVHEAHAGLVAFGMQRDLEGGRSGWDRVTFLFPSEGEDDLLHGNDLGVLARRL